MHTSVAVSETNSNKNDIQIKNNTAKRVVCCFLFDTAVVFYVVNTKNIFVFSSLKNTGGMRKSVDFSI